MKKCFRCGLEKDKSEFGPRLNRSGGLQPWCRECTAKTGKEYYHRVLLPKRIHLKELVFRKFGECCAFCRFTDKRALQIDHVFNDGNLERRTSTAALACSIPFLKKVLADSEGRYQLLCANCNIIKNYIREGIHV